VVVELSMGLNLLLKALPPPPPPGLYPGLKINRGHSFFFVFFPLVHIPIRYLLSIRRKINQQGVVSHCGLSVYNEVVSEAILENGLEVKEEELLHVAIGDTNPTNEMLPTPRRSSWRQYIPTWGTPTQMPIISTYAPQI
jgi:hypothetical protein